MSGSTDDDYMIRLDDTQIELERQKGLVESLQQQLAESKKKLDDMLIQNYVDGERILHLQQQRDKLRFAMKEIHEIALDSMEGCPMPEFNYFETIVGISGENLPTQAEKE